MEKDTNKRRRTLTALLAIFMVTEDYQEMVNRIEELYGFKNEEEK